MPRIMFFHGKILAKLRRAYSEHSGGWIGVMLITPKNANFYRAPPI